MYLSSIANKKTFFENTSSDFENRILPINLDLNREYEVGLSNILFPKFFYCFRERDANCGIQFREVIKRSEFEDYEYSFYNYLPKRNIISNFKEKNIISIVGEINHQLMKELKGILKDKFTDYFPYAEIIYYDSKLKKVVINKTIISLVKERYLP